MLQKVLGVFHLLHAPILTFIPFYVNNQLADIIYINYFFLIMFSYTFINGECPISYISKKIIDRDYFAGKDIEYYPEMRMFFNTDKDIQDYFTTTSIAMSQSAPNNFGFQIGVATGLTAGQPTSFDTNATTSALLFVSAEL